MKCADCGHIVTQGGIGYGDGRGRTMPNESLEEICGAHKEMSIRADAAERTVITLFHRLEAIERELTILNENGDCNLKKCERIRMISRGLQ